MSLSTSRTRFASSANFIKILQSNICNYYVELQHDFIMEDHYFEEVLFIITCYPLQKLCRALHKFVWIKKNRRSGSLFTGMGYYTRSNAEICLLALRGKMQRQSKSIHQIIHTHIERHSQKQTRRAGALLTCSVICHGSNCSPVNVLPAGMPGGTRLQVKIFRFEVYDTQRICKTVDSR